ncbi:MAG: GAF domain-containing sensor histidine kinase, partial [Dehalococcoidia bacterium]
FILGHYRGDERAPLWLWLITVILLIIILGPLWQRVRSWTNWLFYRERYKHLKALDHLQEEAQSVVDPASVSRIFPQLIKQAMEASHLYLLLPSQSSGDFGIAASAGSNNTDSQLSLGKSSPIIKWLESHDDLIHREDLVVIPQLQTLSIREKETLDKMAGELYVPLKSSRRLVGLLIVGPRIDGQPYSWEDEGIINKTTGQLALNIENIQLYNASLEREKQLAALNSLNKAISSSLDIQSTYDLFAGELKKVVPVDWASITLIEDDALRFFALSTTIDSTWGKPGTTIPLKGTATEWIIINKRTLVENDLARRRFFVTGEAHLDHGIRSIAYLPLFSQGDVTGSFIVGCSRPNAYGEREVDFLGQVASQLSLTMENARLYARERGGRARLEILNEQREEFFRAIAHELKTPLTAIKSSGELLSEELVGEGQAPLKRLIDNIRRSADRLEAMLNDLLEMAKARAVPLEMHFQSMDVPAAIRSTVDLCSPSIKQKHQTLTVDIPEECPRIMADPKWFEYIITNLLSNANKFTPEGGKIKLAVWIEDAMMMMAVEDTGAGIPAEEQDLIFEPFYRGKHSGERIKGIGVGLATVKQITRLHGGKVQVSSEFGKGSVFTVSLPLP